MHHNQLVESRLEKFEKINFLLELWYTDDVEKIESKPRLDTIFNFRVEDLTPVSYIAETLDYGELNAFIKKEKKRQRLWRINEVLVPLLIYL